MKKRDLLLTLYMGGPDSIEAIEPFLFNLFTDRSIIDFGIGERMQRFVAKKIAKSRSRKIAPEYERMGGSSPQLRHLTALLTKVKSGYEETTGRELVVESGMCYYHPFIEESVDKLRKDEFENIYVTSLYPQWSYTTSGVCFRRFEEAQNILPLNGKIHMQKFWHLDDGYNTCIAKRIEQAAEKLGKPLPECHLLISAHSLPEYTLSKGDPYTDHLDQQIKKLVELTKPGSHSLSYQSRTGPIKWLSPETNVHLDELHQSGVDNIIVLPISFVSDHIETLIELDEGYIHEAREKGMNIVRAESLNDSDDFAVAFRRLATGV